MTFYLVSSVSLEYIGKMINGSHILTKRPFIYKNLWWLFQRKKVYYKICKILLLLHGFFKCYIFILYFWQRKNLLDYDSKEENLKFYFFYMFSDYVMSLFKNKRCYSSNFQPFLVLLQLHLLISWHKNFTNMFVVSTSISTLQLSLPEKIKWKEL